MENKSALLQEYLCLNRGMAEAMNNLDIGHEWIEEHIEMLRIEMDEIWYRLSKEEHEYLDSLPETLKRP